MTEACKSSNVLKYFRCVESFSVFFQSFSIWLYLEKKRVPKPTSNFNLINTTMITFMDENGIRTFKFNGSDNLIASWATQESK